MFLFGVVVVPLVLLVYMMGWVAATKHYLRKRMLEEVCAICGRDSHSFWHERGCAVSHSIVPVPRGAFRERNPRDVTESMKEAVLWPGLAVIAGITAMGRATVRHVSARTPLTAPELERRIRERAASIDRVMEELK